MVANEKLQAAVRADEGCRGDVVGHALAMDALHTPGQRSPMLRPQRVEVDAEIEGHLDRLADKAFGPGDVDPHPHGRIVEADAKTPQQRLQAGGRPGDIGAKCCEIGDVALASRATRQIKDFGPR